MGCNHHDPLKKKYKYKNEHNTDNLQTTNNDQKKSSNSKSQICENQNTVSQSMKSILKKTGNSKDKSKSLSPRKKDIKN